MASISNAPNYTIWKIACHSGDEAQALQEWLAGRIDLDRVLTDTVRVTPEGAEQLQTARHLLGDYFADIRILPDLRGNPASFRLVFHRRSDAGRFWKDLMVNILQEVDAAPQKTSIDLESKGEVAPVWNSSVR